MIKCYYHGFVIRVPMDTIINISETLKLESGLSRLPGSSSIPLRGVTVPQDGHLTHNCFS